MMKWHPAMDQFAALSALYMQWWRVEKPGDTVRYHPTHPCVLATLEAAHHAVRRVGREPNRDNRWPR